jgi:type II secretory pathway component PulK
MFFGAALTLELHSSTRIARNMADNAAARAAADAGVQRAILDLVSSPNAVTDTRKFRADGTVYAWRFANCSVRLSVQDERGKIDLNEAPEALLTALIESVGVDRSSAQSLADAIADFRDADNLPRLSGAEEADYRTRGVAWGPKNAPFQSLEEVQQVLGMTPEIYGRIAPHLTTYARRNELDYLNSLGLDMGYFSIRSDAHGPNGAVFVREAVVQLRGATPVQILAWRQGTKDMRNTTRPRQSLAFR